MKRNYDRILLYCLRKSIWPWAISRAHLAVSPTVPVNEFKFAWVEPPDLIKLLRIYTDDSPLLLPEDNAIQYKRESGFILSNETIMTIKYINNKALDNPSIMDPTFVEYFAAELAYAVCYKITNSVDLRKELYNLAMQLFKEAAAVASQEDN